MINETNSTQQPGQDHIGNYRRCSEAVNTGISKNYTTQNLSQSYNTMVADDDRIQVIKPPGIEFKKLNYKNGNDELEKLAAATEKNSDYQMQVKFSQNK